MRAISVIATTLFASLTCAYALAGPDATPRRYSLKELDSSFATPFSRKLATGSAIPFYKTYAELSQDERALLRSQYEDMAEADEPPFPVGGLAPLYRAVADGQQKRLAQGDLSIIVEVDSSGQATQASVHQTPDPALANYVATVLLKQNYKPAVCSGKPCAMQFPFRVKLAVE